MANTTNLDLVKPLGTDHALISVINGNMDKVDAYAGNVNNSLAGIQDGMAIVAVGDTHAAITSGQFVYVKEHNTLPEGLYTASANIAANGALSTSNLTADSKGGLNALSDQIGKYAKWKYRGAVSGTSTLSVANNVESTLLTALWGGYYCTMEYAGQIPTYGLLCITLKPNTTVYVQYRNGDFSIAEAYDGTIDIKSTTTVYISTKG